MASAFEIGRYLDELLEIKDFPGDASNNGLQFDAGDRDVKKILFTVDACAASFRAAADTDADMIFVHHGISWGGSLKKINALDAERIAMLAANGCSLYAVHLPLDAHHSLGHNALIADMLSLRNRHPFGVYGNTKIGWYGDLPKAMTAENIAKLLDAKLFSQGEISLVNTDGKKLKRIGVVSGGGAVPSFFAEMRSLGIECLVTGEFTHEAFHSSVESGTGAIALGHYRSETPGVCAVAEAVAQAFGVECYIADIPTGF